MIKQLLDDCRKMADDVTKHHHRKTRYLYAVLASAAHICETCNRDIDAQQELTAAFKTQQDNVRRWIEKDSDTYTLVCRYVFNGTNHGNISRYAQTLRQAAKRQIASDKLHAFLLNKGGVSALFLKRETVATQGFAKTLQLDRRITWPKYGTITLRIQHTAANYFHVLDDE